MKGSAQTQVISASVDLYRAISCSMHRCMRPED